MSTPAYSIDLATPGDIDALIGLLQVLFAIEQDFEPAPELQRCGLGMLLERPDAACIVVARHPRDGVVGMASAQLVVSTASGGYSAWVEDVVVAEAHRGQGLARALLDALSDWAEQCGARRMQLLADADNPPALAMYERLGWRPTRLFAWRRTLD
ncbi:MAG: GNAT family N-acetyltransferase [Pseudomonadota bacterium]